MSAADFGSIVVGDAVRRRHVLDPAEVAMLARIGAAGALEGAGTPPTAGAAAVEAWCGAIVSATISGDFPGPRGRLLRQELTFLRPLRIGESLEIVIAVAGRDGSTGELTLDCRGLSADGALVLRGTALVVPATAAAALIAAGHLAVPDVPAAAVPATSIAADDAAGTRPRRYRQLLDSVAGLPPLRVAIVHPCSVDALRGAIEAARMGLIEPVLIGPEAKIRSTAELAGIDLAPWTLVPVAHSHAAAECAATMARSGEVRALMKGSLHTDELMHEVVRADSGLRTERRASHVFVLDVPAYPKPLAITDGAVNIEPDLETKRDIVQNAIDLMQALGIAQPKVAILAAVETVSARMRSTIDAAALCKMADRGQILGGIVDGPLAFDNAISPNAALGKAIVSPVAGDADILVAPDLEAANMLAKQLQYLADAQSAGLVMGARVPVILTSRAEGSIARIGSCALALLVCHARFRAARTDG